MNFNFEQGEIFLIDKPFRWTSFDVVNNLRGFLHSRLGIKKMKIGHMLIIPSAIPNTQVRAQCCAFFLKAENRNIVPRAFVTVGIL